MEGTFYTSVVGMEGTFYTSVVGMEGTFCTSVVGSTFLKLLQILVLKVVIFPNKYINKYLRSYHHLKGVVALLEKT